MRNLGSSDNTDTTDQNPLNGKARAWVCSARIVNLLSLTVLMFIGWIDYATGYEFGFFIFYFIPVAISAWFISLNSGLFMACASAFIWYLSDKYTFHPYSKSYLIYWEMWMRLISFLTTALTVSRIRANLDREKELNTKLSHALREIEELKCRLPECDACRLLREDSARLERLASSSVEEQRERDDNSPTDAPKKPTHGE